MALDCDNHGETDRGFGGGDGDGEDRNHYAGRLRRLRCESPKCDEVDVRRGQHHLDPDQNENGVTPAERGEQSDAKQCRGENEKELECWSHRVDGWWIERSALDVKSVGEAE